MNEQQLLKELKTCDDIITNLNFIIFIKNDQALHLSLTASMKKQGPFLRFQKTQEVWVRSMANSSEEDFSFYNLLFEKIGVISKNKINREVSDFLQKLLDSCK